MHRCLGRARPIDRSQLSDLFATGLCRRALSIHHQALTLESCRVTVEHGKPTDMLGVLACPLRIYISPMAKHAAYCTRQPCSFTNLLATTCDFRVVDRPIRLVFTTARRQNELCTLARTPSSVYCIPSSKVCLAHRIVSRATQNYDFNCASSHRACTWCWWIHEVRDAAS